MQMNELLPCPFCGGEAEPFNPFGNADGTWCVLCSECASATGFEQTEAEAIAAWNSRAERTCKFVSSKGSDYPPVCSACGYELGIYDCEWFDDGTYGYERNYCPNCGCKVVSE